MAIPSVDLCGWAVTDVVLPVMNKANKEKPIDDLINKGWDMNESPAADEFNYMLNNYYQWINYLKTDIAPVVVNATSSNTPNTIVKRDGSGNFSAGTITAYLQGTAATAENNSHTHVSANITDATENNTPNTVVKRNASGNATFNMVYSNITGNLNGNSTTATTLQTGRTIAVSNAVVSTPTPFNGASNISIPVTSVDASYLTNTVPVANLSGTYNINISGNSATATKLATARTISITGGATGSASFDGSSDISINISTPADVMTALWTGSATSATVDISGYIGKETIICIVDSNVVVFKNIPVNFITSVKTSGQIYIDYGDSADFVFDYSVSGNILTLSNLARGNFTAIYGR